MTVMERLLRGALVLSITAVAWTFGGCATTGSRISSNPEMFQRLSATDQALVTQGQIRRGMTMDAVWLAWGKPEQKIPGDANGGPGETWVYLRYATPPSYGGPYYYGPFDWTYIPPKFPYPGRAVTFRNNRVAFFRYLPSPPPL